MRPHRVAFDFIDPGIHVLPDLRFVKDVAAVAGFNAFLNVGLALLEEWIRLTAFQGALMRRRPSSVPA